MARRFLALLALAAGDPATAAGNLSDHWWNPAQSGSGLMLEQRDDRAYALLYTYAASGLPIWYVAPNLTAASTTPDGLPRYTGALVRMFANPPGSPSPHDADQIGEIEFAPSSTTAATLRYTILGVATEQPVRRLDYGETRPEGRYVATVAFRPDRGGEATFALSFDAATDASGAWRLTSRQTLADGSVQRCTYAAAPGRPLYRQNGRLGDVDAVADCDGTPGTLRLRDLEVTPAGFAGKFERNGTYPVANGRIGAVKLATD